MASLRLPHRSRVVLTGETDPVLRHYQPVVGYFMNKRLSMGIDLLGTRRFRRLLDAGYGGGIFLPELAARADELYGIDVHPHREAVERMAEAEGIRVQLRKASITDTGFPDGYFDGVVSISVLEFVEDLRGAMTELARITQPGGVVILGFPGENAVTALGYRLARTPDPRRVHRANYRAIVAEASRHLRLKRVLRFPSWMPDGVALFFAGEFERS